MARIVRHARRVGVAAVGFPLLILGVVMLAAPGPGLLVILASLLLLATEFPFVERHVDPIRARALAAADESVASPLRIVGSAIAGLALVVVGVIWAVNENLPLGGLTVGVSVTLSGVCALGLLAFSYRRRGRG